MIKLIGFYDYTVILTYMSLFSAVFGIHMAVNENFNISIICLFFSGFCDAFDGMVARSKKNRTEDEKAFGIQLDSLCDIVSFGVFPAVLCYLMGANGPIGVLFAFLYVLCALIRLAFFNVIEEKRQKTEGGCNKSYRGLPVTTIAMILPFIYCFHNLFTDAQFIIVLHIVLVVVAFLFVLDFSVPKLDWKKILFRK